MTSFMFGSNPIGDGVCHSGFFYSAECGWEEGYCDDFFAQYPDCTNVEFAYKVGDGICDTGGYNTAACGFDGGDCVDFNLEYSNCYGVNRVELGDGICQHNTAGCNFDDGDCVRFNTLYPNCTADKSYRVGDGYCDEEYNTPLCKNDGGDCASINERFLFLNGQKVTVEEYEKDTKTYSIIQTISSAMSLVASIGIIWIIQRSFRKLSVPFHRLLVGVCVADICSSFALLFFTLPAPDPFDIIWNAKGNQAACQTQGFFISLGSMGAPLYNCSLCVYYYIVVTYKKGKDADTYIKGKVKYFLYGIPIFVSLVAAITILSMDAYHPNMTYCFIGANPNCREDECDQLNKNANALFLIFSAVPYFIFPCVIILTMGGMYRKIKVQEKKLQRFGRGSLVLMNTISVRKPKGIDESREDLPHPRNFGDG